MKPHHYKCLFLSLVKKKIHLIQTQVHKESTFDKQKLLKKTIMILEN